MMLVPRLGFPESRQRLCRRLLGYAIGDRRTAGHWLAALTLFATISACAATRPSTHENSTESASRVDLSCADLPPGAETLELAGRMIAIGEFHGTREAPAVVTALLCHAAQLEPGVRLAVEVSTSAQAPLDDFMAASADADARAILLGSEPFQRHYQDGRTSAAMFDLLVEARRLTQAGRKVGLLAFDHQAPQPERDRAMAKTVGEARRAEPEGTMILLTGNFHAAKRRGNSFNPDFLSMAFRLSQGLREVETQTETQTDGLDLTALKVEVATGTAWYCTDSSESSCGPKATGGRNLGDTPFISLDSELAGEGFDGLIYLPSASASPPAVAAD